MWISLAPRLALAALFATAAFASNQAFGQATDVTFNVAGPADWNTDANWDPMFVPQGQFNEIAVIPSNRHAVVDDTPPNAGNIIITAGTLEIAPGGNLTAVADDVVQGILVVGQAGAGNLIVRRGGTLNVQNLTTGGGATSQITLGETGGTGTATLTVAGATLNRETRIVGPNVSLSSTGDLTFASPGTLVPVITGSTHSTINVTGTAMLGGSLRPEFSGYTPVLGNSWNLVTAGNVTGAFSLDLSQASDMPRGTGFNVNQTSTTTTLEFTNKLLLTVDRATGQTSIANVVGSPISIDGYTVTSAGGHLDGTWNSLADQNLSDWDEADNADSSRRTEFNPSGSSTVNVGSSLALGNLYAPPAPAAFGEVTGEDLSFEYAVSEEGATPGRTMTGIVEYTGGRNNLVLTIDPTTGAAAIQNQSPFFDVAIDAYSISSASGRLQTGVADWNSLQDQSLSDWDEADNSDAFRLTEFNPQGETAMAGGGTVLELGTPIDASGDPLDIDDFTFEFALAGASSAGDYNENGIVDAADYTVWRDNLGSDTSLPNDDTPGVDTDDYLRWKENFGNRGGRTMLGIVEFGPIPTSATAAGLAPGAVPEPGTMLGLLLTSAILATTRLPQSLLRLHEER